MKKSHPKLVQLIREEFEERPELRLTVHEASQFWALDEAGCEHALMELARKGFLAEDGYHCYHRFRVHAEPRAVFCDEMRR
jgi:Fic family protein